MLFRSIAILIVMALIDAEDIAKSYGSVKAVNGLSLRLDEGSVTGLIGPNGAGKTTMIKMILGLLKPDRGRSHFSSRIYDKPDRHRAFSKTDRLTFKK